MPGGQSRPPHNVNPVLSRRLQQPVGLRVKKTPEVGRSIGPSYHWLLYDFVINCFSGLQKFFLKKFSSSFSYSSIPSTFHQSLSFIPFF
jgi:hypothetical protein